MIPATPLLSLNEQTQFVLADVETCKANIDGPLNIRLYKEMENLQVVDMTCIQSLVGRVKTMRDRGQPLWAIVDRNGELDGAIYADENQTG